jgi:large subunit ribosomal protein L19
MDAVVNKPNPNIPELSPGDTVKLNARIGEKGKEHTQMFNGTVIKVRKGADGGNFTIRRVSHGVGVEHTFPMASPMLEKVEIVRRGKVRRARLYYLRGLSAKASRTKEKLVKERETAEETTAVDEAQAAPEAVERPETKETSES